MAGAIDSVKIPNECVCTYCGNTDSNESYTQYKGKIFFYHTECHTNFVVRMTKLSR